VKFLAREAAVQIALAQQGLQHVGVLNEGLAQITAVSEDDQSIVGERIMTSEQSRNLRRCADQPVEHHDRRIWIGRFRQQSRQSRDKAVRQLR
jgi:hypothetical protein